MQRTLISLTLAGALLAAAACSDDTEPITDGGVDATIDGMVVSEAGADLTVDMPTDDMMTDDMMTDDMMTDDMATDMPMADMPLADGPTGDMPMTDGPTGDMPMTDGPTGDMPMTDMATVDATPATDGGPATFTAPFSWDFESSCQNLSATKDWECGQINFTGGTCGIPPTKSASGTGKGMWGPKLNTCYGNLGNNQGSSSSSCSNTTPSDDSILSFKVTIPATWTTATLTYYEWVDVNGYFDWMEVRVDSTSVKTYCNPSPATSSTTWAKQTIDLSSYTGKTITVAFHFLASSVVNKSGWYLDDMSISGS